MELTNIDNLKCLICNVNLVSIFHKKKEIIKRRGCMRCGSEITFNSKTKILFGYSFDINMYTIRSIFWEPEAVYKSITFVRMNTIDNVEMIIEIDEFMDLENYSFLSLEKNLNRLLKLTSYK